MDPVVGDLVDQQDELGNILQTLDVAQWSTQTRCVGWTVSDVVLHLAQSDQMAIDSLNGHLGHGTAERAAGSPRPTNVDELVASMVERERGLSPKRLLMRWTQTADNLIGTLNRMDLSRRVQWVAGDLSARTLASTRLAETWIHASDVANAVGIELAPSDRLKHIARLAWRTLPYAFASAGLEMTGPVAFHLTAPDGSMWNFLPDQTVITTISGSALELCEVAGRRLNAEDSSLTGEGPDVANVLSRARTYA